MRDGRMALITEVPKYGDRVMGNYIASYCYGTVETRSWYKDGYGYYKTESEYDLMEFIGV